MSASSAQSHARRALQKTHTNEKLNEIAKAIEELAKAVEQIETESSRPR